MHVAPSEGQSRDVAGPVLDMLFPPGTQSRVPIASITGTNGKTTTTPHDRPHLQDGGPSRRYGDLRWRLRRRPPDGRGRHGPGRCRQGWCSRDPSIDAAVLETARGRPLETRHGLSPAERRGRLERPGRPTWAFRGIDTLEDLAEVKRVVVEVAEDTAVLNADDPLCLKMADPHPRRPRLLRNDEPQTSAGCANTSAPAAARWSSKKARGAT